ncbi:cytochrome P450 [Basidiobolus meristosporus CBS 931.73]|uniref:Cytochrome P450 n=1 Tax=Basidiobolus meristosporus CBS 931.73 TaxID=1314790 RepID=A0A1Y1XRY8_9FUNG|nr:cytochrome P450 [Basidiobolus meristosporus CBS 931.73]|eukprot:ORX88518.1 cytochrome P450 [Basidiobolus meristosporus CBS 931.73]
MLIQVLHILEPWLPLALSCYIIYALSERLRCPTLRIPGPILAKLTPLYYYYFTCIGTHHQKCLEWHKKYGPVVLIAPNTVSINDVEVMREIYGSIEYVKDPEFYKMFGENQSSTFNTSDVAFHKKRVRQSIISHPIRLLTLHKKRIIAPAFSQAYFSSMEPLVWQSGVSALMHKFQKSAESKAIVNLHSEFHYMAFDIIGELAFGKSFHLIENADHPILGWIKDSDIRLTLFGLNAQRERRKMNIARRDIFQLMSEASDPDTGEKLTEMELLGESLSQINTLTWAAYLLSKNPNATRKLTEELDGALPENQAKILDSALQQLPYLEAVILETFRCLPTVPIGLPRVVPKGGKNMKGYFLPGGTIVSVPINCLHSDPKVFPDPERFQPERWLVEDTKLMKRHLIPFSYGSRSCIGRHIAMMELRLTLASLYRRFNVQAVPNQIVEDRVRLLILKPKETAFNVHLETRN